MSSPAELEKYTLSTTSVMSSERTTEPNSKVKAEFIFILSIIYFSSSSLQNCYQNKFGIMPYSVHGGSYPYASYSTAGDTAANDNCMAVGVMKKQSTAHGWSQNGYGFDSASSDSDWPNRSHYNQSPNVVVWLK